MCDAWLALSLSLPDREDRADSLCAAGRRGLSPQFFAQYRKCAVDSASRTPRRAYTRILRLVIFARAEASSRATRERRRRDAARHALDTLEGVLSSGFWSAEPPWQPRPRSRILEGSQAHSHSSFPICDITSHDTSNTIRIHAQNITPAGRSYLVPSMMCVLHCTPVRIHISSAAMNCAKGAVSPFALALFATFLS